MVRLQTRVQMSFLIDVSFIPVCETRSNISASRLLLYFEQKHENFVFIETVITEDVRILICEVDRWCQEYYVNNGLKTARKQQLKRYKIKWNTKENNKSSIQKYIKREKLS